jgi:hypothetical protein
MTHCQVKDTGYGTVWHIARWHPLSERTSHVPFIWQCVLRYHDQCLSPGNVSYGTMTSAFHLAMCHTVPRPVSFTYQCIICYHDQCLSSDNVSYGTTTSASHLAMCHMVPWPVPVTWQCVIRYHDQCISHGKALVMVPYDTLPGERHWSWYLKTHCQMKGTGRGSI